MVIRRHRSQSAMAAATVIVGCTAWLGLLMMYDPVTAFTTPPLPIGTTTTGRATTTIHNNRQQQQQQQLKHDPQQYHRRHDNTWWALGASTLDKTSTTSSSKSSASELSSSSPSSSSSSSSTTVTPKRNQVNGMKSNNNNNNNNKSYNNDDNKNSNRKLSFGEQLANSGMASAAAVATAAVNAAVAMKTLEAPDVTKSYISIQDKENAAAGGAANNNNNNKFKSNNIGLIDEDGLPLVYDKDLIEQYWNKERGALNQRWSYFVGKAVPFFSKMITLFIRDGKIRDEEIPSLSRQARLDLQDLGPTFIKAGQMMSVRPDVLPQATLNELQLLQDSVVPFSTELAVQQIEYELGGPLGQFFTSISQEPVAAASLAQVYLATLKDGKDTQVAIKVQRPNVLTTVSKDLYVLRRAAEVFQGLVERFAPQQRTNYVALLNEWAIGFYTELDFWNEAQNQMRLRDLLRQKNIVGVTVPKVYPELCTRRLLVSEWMNGTKLSDCTPQDIAKVTPLAQEAFLTQLFELGFFHADPHPGNLLLLKEPTAEGHTLALIDCGLMASIAEEDRDNMISAVIHLANKDYASLVDDFIRLEILPTDSNRAAIIPLMDKALSPYVKGGGAKKYEEELKRLYGMTDGNVQSQVGGFQAMTQDALTVLNDIPFSIPPYFAILGRAIVTLEGVALTGNPDYGIIMESYPFIARKLLREDRPQIQRALQEVLFNTGGSSHDHHHHHHQAKDLKLSRLLALLNNAAGAVVTKDGAAFVDLDAVPKDGIGFGDGLKFLLSDQAESLRSLLEQEMETIVDILTRQLFRRGFTEALVSLTPPRPPSIPFLGDVFPQPPKLDQVPLPLLLPGSGGGTSDPFRRPSIAVITLKDFVDVVAPKLNQDEEIFAIGLTEAAKEFFGDEVANFLKGESVFSTQTAELVLATLRSGALGRTSMFNSAVAQNVMQFASQLWERVRGSSGPSNVEAVLADAIDKLDDKERERLDTILTELTKRNIYRAVDRLDAIERVL